MGNRKGYVITWDGVLALLFVVFVFSGVIGLQYVESLNEGSMFFEQIHLASENAIETLSKSGLLEEMGVDWANGNYSKTEELESGNLYGASKTAKEVLDQLIPLAMGYRVMADNDTLYDTRYEVNGSRPREEDSSQKTSASRIVSGYAERRPSSGWTARAWLLETEDGSTNLLSETPSGLGGTDFDLGFSSGDSNVLYLRVPLGFAVTNASLKVSWSSMSTTTSATTTSSPSTTLAVCTPCPAEACPAPAYEYSTLFTNWHKFTIGSTCDVRITMTPTGDSDYDLYMNLVDLIGPDECDVHSDPGGNYDHRLEPYCNLNSLNDGSGFVEFCIYDDLPPGTYYMRVDCYYYDPERPPLCSGTYNLTLEGPCFP